MLRRITLAVLVLLVVGAGAAHARSLTIESFHADVEVRPDGAIVVEERIRVRFRGSYNGIFRDIPYGYQRSGIRGKIHLVVEAVEDDTEQPLEYWESRRRGWLNLKIRVPGAADAVRTVVIRYRARKLQFASAMITVVLTTAIYFIP